VAAALLMGVLAASPRLQPRLQPRAESSRVDSSRMDSTQPIDTIVERRPARLGAMPVALFDAPTPVLLVPGWSDGPEHLRALRDRLVGAGWPDSAVAAVAFDDPVGSNREHARTIALEVERLRRASGASEVDVVAHSMGGLAVRFYLQQGGADQVRRVVFLATPHRGTYSAFFAWGAGSEEMVPGSPFLLSLHAWDSLPDPVHGITVRTRVDLHVVPAEHAVLPPLRDHEVCCPTHAGLLDDDETFRVIATFLGGRGG
jgi:triacylglycerol lipase